MFNDEKTKKSDGEKLNPKNIIINILKGGSNNERD